MGREGGGESELCRGEVAEMERRGTRCWWGEGSGDGGERDQVLVGRGIRCWRGEGSGAGGERDKKCKIDETEKILKTAC